MKFKIWLRTLGTAALLSTLFAGGVIQTTTGASTIKKPSIHVVFVRHSVEMKTRVQVKVCGSSLPVGAKSYFEEQEGTDRVWRPVWSVGELTGNRCATRNISQPYQGKFVFRARVWLSKKVPLDSSKAVLTVYGPVAFSTWCGNVSGCKLINGAGKPVQVGSNIDDYVDWVCGTSGDGYCSNIGGNYFPQSYTINAPTSCRSLTLDSVLLASDNGETGGVVTVEVVQHTLNPQYVTPSLNEVRTAAVKLDGGPVVINFTNTGPLSLYFISETANCYTSTGTLTSPQY